MEPKAVPVVEAFVLSQKMSSCLFFGYPMLHFESYINPIQQNNELIEPIYCGSIFQK